MREPLAKLVGADFSDDFSALSSAEIAGNQYGFQDRARDNAEKALKNSPNHFATGSRNSEIITKGC